MTSVDASAGGATLPAMPVDDEGWEARMAARAAERARNQIVLGSRMALGCRGSAESRGSL